jgi:hypothetical protein
MLTVKKKLIYCIQILYIFRNSLLFNKDKLIYFWIYTFPDIVITFNQNTSLQRDLSKANIA